MATPTPTQDTNLNPKEELKEAETPKPKVAEPKPEKSYPRERTVRGARLDNTMTGPMYDPQDTKAMPPKIVAARNAEPYVAGAVGIERFKLDPEFKESIPKECMMYEDLFPFKLGNVPEYRDKSVLKDVPPHLLEWKGNGPYVFSPKATTTTTSQTPRKEDTGVISKLKSKLGIKPKSIDDKNANPKDIPTPAQAKPNPPPKPKRASWFRSLSIKKHVPEQINQGMENLKQILKQGEEAETEKPKTEVETKETEKPKQSEEVETTEPGEKPKEENDNANPNANANPLVNKA